MLNAFIFIVIILYKEYNCTLCYGLENKGRYFRYEKIKSNHVSGYSIILAMTTW